VNTKVCLSFSAYHPELWQPAWGIRLILEALISFVPAPADGAIGALDYSKEERKRLAKASVNYCCPRCGNAAALLPKLGSTSGKSKATGKFADQVKKLHQLQSATEGAKSDGKTETTDSTESENVDDKDTVDNATDESSSSTDEKNDTKLNTAEPTAESESSTTMTPESKPAEKTDNDNATNNITENSENNTEELPQPVPQTQPQVAGSWLSDSLLHGSIVTFAAIIFLLLRKVDSLLEELKSLNENGY